jgi:hypothetical protein
MTQKGGKKTFNTHAYIHARIQTCIHTYIITRTHTYIITRTHTYIITCTHTYISTCTHACMRWMHACAHRHHAHIQAHAWKDAYSAIQHNAMHACMHTCDCLSKMHTYIYIHIIAHNTYIDACMNACIHMWIHTRSMYVDASRWYECTMQSYVHACIGPYYSHAFVPCNVVFDLTWPDLTWPDQMEPSENCFPWSFLHISISQLLSTSCIMWISFSLFAGAVLPSFFRQPLRIMHHVRSSRQKASFRMVDHFLALSHVSPSKIGRISNGREHQRRRKCPRSAYLQC